jgi:hypothetical protein
LAGATVGAAGCPGTVAVDTAFTTRVALVVWVAPPLNDPVIVIGYEPASVVGEVVTENVDVDDVDVGTKLPEAPAGKPLADNETAPAPPVGATVIV